MKDNTGLVIIGAGGHAKVVLSTAIAAMEIVSGLLDDTPELVNKKIGGYSVLGNIKLLTSGSFDHAVIGIGSNTARKRIAQQHSAHGRWKTLIHPTAYVHPSAKLGVGTVVFAGAVIQPDTVIGDHCIINTGATVDHDCVIESYAHLAPGVHLAGGVTVGEGCFLGIGSVAIPNIHIGEWTEVAAGAVVVRNIAANKKIMGVPAKERIEEYAKHG